MSRAAWSIVGAVAVVVSLLVFWIYRPKDDCAFSGWKRTVGVELEAQVQDLQAVKSKIGISDSQIREFDTLMKDYALKYDAACADMRAEPPRMTKDQYTCMRQNMDRVLDSVRSFVQAVEAAKQLTDASAQKAVILQALEDLRFAAGAKYRSGCTSAMDVNPKTIEFAGLIPERSIRITNGGNNEFTYRIDGWPDGFDPHPTTGKLQQGETASVAVMRNVLPVPATRPLTFHVRSNLLDDVEVEIRIDAQNSRLWEGLRERLQAVTPRPQDATLDQALIVIDEAQGGAAMQEAQRLLMASTLLLHVHANEEASMALAAVSEKDPELARRPSTLLLNGLLANRTADRARALQLFMLAGRLTTKEDSRSTVVYDLLSGVLQYDTGDEAAFRKMWTPGIEVGLRSNPSLTAFAAKEICDENSGRCVAALQRQNG